MKHKDENGNVIYIPYLVEKKPANGLTGKYIKRAFANRDPAGEPEVIIDFDKVGGDKFGQFTTRTCRRLHGRCAGRGNPNGAGIRTAYHWQAAARLAAGRWILRKPSPMANMLENPLETPVHIDAMSQISPTLGTDPSTAAFGPRLSARCWWWLFMAVYYHRCGLIADFAMLLNLVITLGIMCSIGTTLSLPGIAGIVLTVGMAVDANVLIYERLREEMALGKSMQGRHRRRLQPRLCHHFRLPHHHAHFRHHPHLHGHRAGQGIRRHPHHRRGVELVHRPRGDATDF